MRNRMHLALERLGELRFLEVFMLVSVVEIFERILRALL